MSKGQEPTIFSRIGRLAAWAGLLALSAWLAAGCGPGEESITCAPPEAAEALTGPPAPPSLPAAPPAQPEPPGVDIYLDGSASMLGYLSVKPGDLKGKSGKKVMFRDVLLALPSAAVSISYRLRYHRFDTGVHDLGETLYVAAAELCDDQCQKQFTRVKNNPQKHPTAYEDLVYRGDQSRLDRVLEQVAERPRNLAVVVSDLFLSGEVLGGNLAGNTGGILRPLRKILDNKCAVGLVAVRSHFDGKLYDFPPLKGLSQPHEYRGEHPFYVMIIGPPELVLKFYGYLGRQVLDALPGDSRHFLLFRKVAPGPDAGEARAGFRLLGDKGVEEEASLFDLPAKDPLEPNYQLTFRPGLSGVRLAFDLRPLERDHGLPLCLDHYQARVWSYQPAGACGDSWARQPDAALPFQPLKTTVASPAAEGRAKAPAAPKTEAPATDDQAKAAAAADTEAQTAGQDQGPEAADPWEQVLLLAPPDRPLGMFPGTTYYVQVQAFARRSLRELEERGWVGRWSFQGVEGRSYMDAKDLEMFPTYNLRPMLQMLAVLSGQEAESRRVAVVDLGLRVK